MEILETRTCAMGYNNQVPFIVFHLKLWPKSVLFPLKLNPLWLKRHPKGSWAVNAYGKLVTDLEQSCRKSALHDLRVYIYCQIIPLLLSLPKNKLEHHHPWAKPVLVMKEENCQTPCNACLPSWTSWKLSGNILVILISGLQLVSMIVLGFQSFFFLMIFKGVS